MPDPRRLSPLAHRPAIAAEDGRLRLAERQFLGKFVLRAAPELAASALKSALKLELPTACRAIGTETLAVLWLGPDEWQVVVAPEDATATLDKLSTALLDTHHQLADVSDYHTTIEISGPAAAETLMKLTPLDLDPRAFEPGQVAGSVFGKAQGVLHRREDGEGGPVFDLQVRWSMADYLWCVLAEGGREFGLPPQTPAYKVPLRA